MGTVYLLVIVVTFSVIVGLFLRWFIRVFGQRPEPEEEEEPQTLPNDMINI